VLIEHILRKWSLYGTELQRYYLEIINIILKIFKVLGTPNEETWPGWKNH